jgi:hypothetical protein
VLLRIRRRAQRYGLVGYSQLPSPRRPIPVGPSACRSGSPLTPWLPLPRTCPASRWRMASGRSAFGVSSRFGECGEPNGARARALRVGSHDWPSRRDAPTLLSTNGIVLSKVRLEVRRTERVSPSREGVLTARRRCCRRRRGSGADQPLADKLGVSQCRLTLRDQQGRDPRRLPRGRHPRVRRRRGHPP